MSERIERLYFIINSLLIEKYGYGAYSYINKIELEVKELAKQKNISNRDVIKIIDKIMKEAKSFYKKVARERAEDIYDELMEILPDGDPLEIFEKYDMKKYCFNEDGSELDICVDGKAFHFLLWPGSLREHVKESGDPCDVEHFERMSLEEKILFLESLYIDLPRSWSYEIEGDEYRGKRIYIYNEDTDELVAVIEPPGMGEWWKVVKGGD